MGLPAKLYTPEEVAANLKVSRRTVYQWLTSGKLKGLRAGQTWRISEEALVEFMGSASGASERTKKDET